MSSLSPNMGLVLPDVNDQVTDTITDLANNFTYIDALFPVGTIYESTVYNDPNTFRPGTWTRITDRFLMAGGTTYSPGTTGGSATHKHYKDADGSPGPNPISTVANVAGDYAVGKGSQTRSASSLPPYLAVYVWERTA